MGYTCIMPMPSVEEQREYQNNWIKQRRVEWIESQGGVCAHCGSSERLEVDHIDRSKKTLYPRAIWSRRKEVRDKELENCQVLCYVCHKKKTSSELSTATHGSVAMYRRGCKCRDCMDANRDKKREYRTRKKRNN